MNPNKLCFLKKSSLTIGIFLFLLIWLCFPSSKQPLLDIHQPYNYIGKNGMVVAAHPLAANAGLEMLKKGGNAVDAAVTTAFTLNAAEPFASGIGGGGFMVIYIAKERKVTTVNFREKAPSKASPNMFMENGKINEEWRKTHGLSVAVPGVLAGLDYALKKYGTKKLSETMAKAIEISEKGFQVSKTFSAINKDEYEKLLLNAGESSCYLNQSFPYEPGDVFRNPELSRTLRLISRKGITVFYKGEIAHKIVKAVKSKGGILILEDLAQYKPVEQSPIKGTYKDYTIFTIGPPASGGLHVIQLLNILENWPVKEWGLNSTAYIHHFSEALRFVFADRSHYLGDPDFISIPIINLLSKEYASHIAGQINPARPLDFYPYSEFHEQENAKENTTHFCVIDKEGNIVSLTQSINHFFGSGIVPEGTGFLLNNHMDDFSRNADSPNAPGPNHRPVSSMGPLIMFKGDMPFLALGSPGGTRIFSSLAQIIVNVIDFGLSLDEAIESPRFFSYSSQGKARSIFVESRIPKTSVQDLEKVGHTIQVRQAYDRYFGGAQGIIILPYTRIIHGGADSRRDGCGVGY